MSMLPHHGFDHLHELLENYRTCSSSAQVKELEEMIKQEYLKRTHLLEEQVKELAERVKALEERKKPSEGL